MKHPTSKPGDPALENPTAEAGAFAWLRNGASPQLLPALGCIAILAASFAACSAPPAARPVGQSVEVSPADERIHYEGRIDCRDAQQPTMSFPGSAIAVHFQGSGFDAKLSTTIADHFQAVIDGQAGEPFALTKEPASYPVAHGLPAGEHTAVLYKCTETNRGTTRFYGLSLAQGTRLLPAPHPKRIIEFIGDSITCGYGDMAANQHVPVSPENSNWYFSYGAVTARELGAEPVTVAVSGIPLTQANEWPAMPAVYLRVHSSDGGYLWDFARGPVPDVVVFDLGTNDFSHRKGLTAPDEAAWTKALSGFLDFVRAHRPTAEIYVADGPMMGPGPDLDNLRAWNREVVEGRRASGDSRCHVLSFAVQRGEDGYGSDWHPSVKTHAKMAEQLVAAIRADTGW